MIIINGTECAESKKEQDKMAIDSLFSGSSTNTPPRIQRLKRKIRVFDAKGILRGIVSEEGVIGSATAQKDGTTWYSYMWPLCLGKEPSYAAQNKIVAALVQGKDRIGRLYK